MSHGQELAIKWATLFLGKPSHTDYRPDWLEGLELDAYWEHINIGLEYQGEQHYLDVYGKENLIKQVGRDKIKKRICRERKMVLIRVDSADFDLEGFEERIRLFISQSKRNRKLFDRISNRTRNKVIPMVRETLGKLISESNDYKKYIKKKYGSPMVLRGWRRHKAMKKLVKAGEAHSDFGPSGTRKRLIGDWQLK